MKSKSWLSFLLLTLYGLFSSAYGIDSLSATIDSVVLSKTITDTALPPIEVRPTNVLPNNVDYANLKSPYHSLYHFFSHMRPNSYNLVDASLCLDAGHLSVAERKKRTAQLYRIIQGRGLTIALENVPRKFDYRDSGTFEQMFIPYSQLPELYLERVGRRWLISKSSVDKIPKWYHETYPFGIDKIVKHIPNALQNPILGVPFWKYLGVIVLLLGAFLTHLLVKVISVAIIRKSIKKHIPEQLKNPFINKTSRPLGLFLAAFLLSVFIPILQFPVEINRVILTALNISMPVFIAVSLWNATDIVAAFFQEKALQTANTYDDMLVPLARKLFKLLIIITALFFLFNALHFNLVAIFTGLSIGGLAVALAAQDTIKNLFGSVMIFIDRPFKAGDWIVTDGVDGVVEDVGFRSTRIRTFEQSLISIPNGRLADLTINNMGLRVYRRYRTMLTIVYGTPLIKIEAFIDGLEKIIDQHPDTRKDFKQVYLHDLSAYSYNILFNVHFSVPDWQPEFKARQEILFEILKLADHIGIEFAFPTQTLHLQKE